MKLLLDTHALIWFLDGDEINLAASTRDAIADPLNDVMVSVVSLWEMVVKARVGKLEVDIEKVTAEVEKVGIKQLALDPGHLFELQRLPFFADHRDPFDHLLIAQAKCDGLVFVSQDKNSSRYEVEVMSCSGTLDDIQTVKPS